MQLQSLVVTNFRVIKRADLTLPDQVIGITGPNGAGKSSLIEAVAWVLYGNQVARSGKDAIARRSAANQGCEVSLAFAIGSEHYTVMRRLVGKSLRPEAILFGGNGQSHEAVGSTEVSRRVGELLGLDWRGFLTSFLARQQELNALAEYAPAQRRDHLAAMLGVQRLDQAMLLARENARRLASEAQATAPGDDRRHVLTNRRSEIAEHVQGTKKQQLAQSGALEDAERRLAETTAKLGEHEARQVKCSQLRAASASTEATLTQLREQESKLRQELDRLVALEAQLRHEERLRLDRRAADLAREGAELEARRAAAATSLEDVRARLRSMPDDVDRELTDITARLEEARVAFSDRQSDLKTASNEVARIKKQVAEVDQIGPEAVCDRCHRPFGDDLVGIREHLHEELDRATGAADEAKAQLAEMTSAGEDLRSWHDDLLQKQRSRIELAAKREQLESRQTDLDTQIAGNRKQLAEAATIETDLAVVAPDEERMAILRGELTRMESLSQSVAAKQGQLLQLPSVRDQAQGLVGRIGAAETELGCLLSELDGLDFDEAAFAQMKRALLTRQFEVSNLRDGVKDAERELIALGREDHLIGDELLQIEERAARADQLRSDQFITEKLVRHLRDFRKLTVSRIRPRLSELAGEILDEASSGRYNILSLDEDYNIQVMDHGEMFEIDRFSGGEKDLASLCLRLAISLALTEAAGLERSFVILDEVFGSQDAGRRDSIVEALANLRHRFPQMILITHLEELKHRVESLIEVVPTSGGWS